MIYAAIIAILLGFLDGTLEGIWTNHRQKKNGEDLPHSLLWAGRVFVCAVISLFTYRCNESAWHLPMLWVMAFTIWATIHRLGYNLRRMEFHPWWYMGVVDEKGSFYDELIHTSSFEITGSDQGARPFLLATAFEISVAILCAIAISLT